MKEAIRIVSGVVVFCFGLYLIFISLQHIFTNFLFWFSVLLVALGVTVLGFSLVAGRKTVEAFKSLIAMLR